MLAVFFLFGISDISLSFCYFTHKYVIESGGKHFSIYVDTSSNCFHSPASHPPSPLTHPPLRATSVLDWMVSEWTKQKAINNWRKPPQNIWFLNRSLCIRCERIWMMKNELKYLPVLFKCNGSRSLNGNNTTAKCKDGIKETQENVVNNKIHIHLFSVKS